MDFVFRRFIETFAFAKTYKIFIFVFEIKFCLKDQQLQFINKVKIVNAFIVVEGAMGNNYVLSGNVQQGIVISKEANCPAC